MLKRIFTLMKVLKSVAKHLSFATEFIEQTETLIKKHYGDITETQSDQQK